MELLIRIATLATRLFAPLVVAAAVLALYHPPLFLWVLPWIPWFLGAIMFGMGVTLTGQDFRRIAQRPWDVLTGVAAQFGIMAALGWLIAGLLRLPPELAVGVILLGTCPGGTASNVITFIARGDVALSVSMTAASTLLAPVLTPLLTLWLAGDRVPVEAGALFVSIVKIVLAPVLLGVALRAVAGEKAKPAIPAFSLISVVGILLIVGAVAGNSREVLFASGLAVFAAVILHNTCGLGLGYFLGWLTGMDEARRRAISLEVGMQNSGLAVALANQHFASPAALPAALFSVWHNISGPLLANFWLFRESLTQGKSRQSQAQGGEQ